MTYSTTRTDSYTLRISCPATTGLVAMVTSHLAAKGCDITDLAQYDDEDTRRFFMRCVFTVPPAVADVHAVLDTAFHDKAQARQMEWQVRGNARRQRVVLMVSKFDHCLRDLLYRWERQELAMDVVAIVSNHATLEPIAQRYGVPFHHIPVTADTKPAAERQLLALIDTVHADLVVLARYMQILSDDLSRTLAGRCINIHHSFLPSFKGGSPYKQAHQRGVKLVGATAHYVTGDLDEGPIIDQDVRRIDHRYAAPEMESLGRDIEAVVLARALRLHLEGRVFIDGHRTVVFG